MTRDSQARPKGFWPRLLQRALTARSFYPSKRSSDLETGNRHFIACSIDYDKGSPTTRKFFARVQNLFHFAITGQTAAEIVWTRADHSKPQWGSQPGSPPRTEGIYKSDVVIAKNYLTEDQIKALERSVGSFFDYIESQIERHRMFTHGVLVHGCHTFPRIQRLRNSQGQRKSQQETSRSKSQ